MDTHSRHTQRRHVQTPDAQQQGARRSADVVQQPLPFDPLPFDDEVDEPIDLVLTARARRVVAPEALPRLRVVVDRGRERGAAPSGVARVRGDAPPAGDAELLDPRDTRPARARALRRAGLGADEIASQLDVDRLLVEAWIGDVSPRGQRRRPGRRGRPGPAVRSASVESSDDPAWSEARAHARDESSARLAADAGFAFGLGLLAGCATVDAHAVTVRTGDEQLASRLLAWLRDILAIEDTRIRVVLRVGPAVAGDLVRHRWASTLAVEADALALARWFSPPAPDAVEALIRIGDPTVTAKVTGWLDALGSPTSRLGTNVVL